MAVWNLMSRSAVIAIAVAIITTPVPTWIAPR